MRTSLFGPLFGEKVAKQTKETSPPPKTMWDQLVSLMATVDIQDQDLARLRKEQEMSLAEINSLKAVYAERTEEAVALRKELEKLQQHLGTMVQATCGNFTCPDRRRK